VNIEDITDTIASIMERELVKRGIVDSDSHIDTQYYMDLFCKDLVDKFFDRLEGK
jgi:hypothetical protein